MVASAGARVRVAAVAAAMLLAAACSDDAGRADGRVPPDVGSLPTLPVPGTATSSPPSSTVGSTLTPTTMQDALRWAPCGRVECAAFEVPLDHDDPDLGTVTLRLARHAATRPSARIGALVVNPGGPGIAGSYLAEEAEDYFSPRVLERFDVVAWDPRGTGRSGAVDCVDDLDALFALDPTPDGEGERRALLDAAAAFRVGCERRSGHRLPRIGTSDSARDVEAIRAALGEPRISYLGFSYGSELGATYATLYPQRVRAMVLDGGVDPGLSTEELLTGQAVAFERALGDFLADCSSRPSCPFHHGGGSEVAFDGLLARLDASPIASTEVGRPPAGQGVALLAVLQALYDRAYWPTLAAALARAEGGDAGGLLALYDAYLERQPDGSWDDTMEGYLAIGCTDARGPATAVEVDAMAARIEQVAPRLGAFLGTRYWCLGWPEASSPRVAVTAEGAGAVLVIGTTGDTATPYALTHQLADALEAGVLLTWEGSRHGAYVASACVQDAVDAYLVEGTVPAAGATCPG